MAIIHFVPHGPSKQNDQQPITNNKTTHHKQTKKNKRTKKQNK